MVNLNAPIKEVIKSYSLLITGNLRKGFKAYEERLNLCKTLPLIKSNKDNQLWKGENISGKTLLIHHDGGLGDTIQFLRYIPYVKKLNCKIILFLQPELNCLFEHLNVPLIKNSDISYDYDRSVFVCSLPYYFNTTLEDIPDPVFIPSRRQPIEKRIGISWRGGPGVLSYLNRRKIELAEILPIFEIAGYQFVCVQKEITQEESILLDKHNIDQPKIQSFCDTVKILETCEQVITIDGCVAHLSASMKVPTKILLDYMPCWRWLVDRTDSPWYPSAELFRQKTPDIWEDPIQKIVQALEVQPLDIS